MIASRAAAAAALSLFLAGPAAAQPAQVRVDLASFSYAPSPIHLAAGKPVTMNFVNVSGSGHDFTAKKFFANSRITAGSAPGGEIGLGPRQTKTITLVPSAGTYKVHCSHFLHKQFGMRTLIIVR